MSLFKTDSLYYLERFGERIQKIPIDAGFSCPNRDGTKSKRGCSYCNNRSFAPFYATSKLSIDEQLNLGINYFSNRYKADAFFAYFQSYSSTHASVSKLQELYSKALCHDRVIGLIISTRPDCLEADKVSLLKELSNKTFVKLEVGVESMSDEALKLANRQHRVKESLEALEILKQNNILFGIHLIATLPGDSKEKFLRSLPQINQSGAKFIKVHHLQIIKDTLMAKNFLENRKAIKLFSLNEYTELMSEFVARLSPEIYIERLVNRVPPKFLIAPNWQNINENIFREGLELLMKQKKYVQGCLADNPITP